MVFKQSMDNIISQGGNGLDNMQKAEKAVQAAYAEYGKVVGELLTVVAKNGITAVISTRYCRHGELENLGGNTSLTSPTRESPSTIPSDMWIADMNYR